MSLFKNKDILKLFKKEFFIQNIQKSSAKYYLCMLN